jgi:hypothetical protein
MIKSPYAGEKIVLTTQHQKEQIIGPVFQASLHSDVILHQANTDLLGTFSGEIERESSAIDCAKKKCLLGIEQSGLVYGLASEGRFGPHPAIPFLQGNQEILCFYDKRADFFVIETYFTSETNYKMISTNNWNNVCQFATNALFPEHGLIVKPNIWEDKSIIFKGINNLKMLKKAFEVSQASSSDQYVQIETDMRAHMNPLRQKAIKIAAKKLVHRLQQYCPTCQNPGWGKVGLEKGLPCMACYFETELAKKEIWGCAKCDHKDYLPRADGIIFASQTECPFCNP